MSENERARRTTLRLRRPRPPLRHPHAAPRAQRRLRGSVKTPPMKVDLPGGGTGLVSALQPGDAFIVRPY